MELFWAANTQPCDRWNPFLGCCSVTFQNTFPFKPLKVFHGKPLVFHGKLEWLWIHSLKCKHKPVQGVKAEQYPVLGGWIAALPTFHSLSPVLRYSNWYFTVHSLKAWTWAGGFHSTSREPRSPGSVIWRSRGGATTLKTKQRVNRVSKWGKQTQSSHESCWCGMLLLLWFVEMQLLDVEGSAAGCSPGCLKPSSQQTHTSSAPAHPPKTSFCWCSEKALKDHWKGTQNATFWHSFSRYFKQNCCLGMTFHVLYLLTFNSWYLPTFSSLISANMFSTHTNTAWQIKACCQGDLYSLTIIDINHSYCFKYSFQVHYRLLSGGTQTNRKKKKAKTRELE